MSVALITGANGGIGHVLCQQFLAAGYDVIATDRDLPTVGRANLSIDLGVFARDDDYRLHALETLHRALDGRALEVLVNNAAFQVVRPFEQLDAEAIRATLDVNVTAAVLLVQGLLEALVAAHGLVLNIGSVHATLTKPGFTAYATSKAAVHGFTRALAVELGGRVRVNAIAPAAIDTAMLRAGFASRPDALGALAHHHPAGELGTAEQVARFAVFLASERAFFASGAIIALDGAIGSRLHDPA